MIRFVIILLFISSAYGGIEFNIALTGMNLSSLADGISTQRALDRGAYEMNPILRGSGDAWPVVKFASTGLATWGLYELHKKKPKLAWALTLGITGTFTYLAIRNNRLNR